MLVKYTVSEFLSAKGSFSSIDFVNIIEASKSVSEANFFFTSTRIWTWNPHSRSEYVFYYTKEANFVVLARFLFLLL